MSKIENSAALNEIIMNANSICQENKTSMTVEHVFLAMVEALEKSYNNNEELSNVKKIFKHFNIDIENTKKVVLSRLSHGTEPDFVDALYMQRKFYDAENMTRLQGFPFVSADILLQCILSDPSKLVETIIHEQAKLSEQKNSVTTDSGNDNASDSEEVEDLIAALDKLEIELEELSKELDDLGECHEDVELPDKGDGKMEALVDSVKDIKSELMESVYGQDNAINTFATGYFQANLLSMIDKSKKRPKATFLFAGPPGVGKTFLAEKAAEALCLPFKRFDMSEYADKEANIEFCGSDKVYKNGKAGNVTSFVAENPECVLLFDEMEKAHAVVIHLFLQMLDAGRLRDNYTDEEVSFSNAIIIMTTNAGKQLYEESESGDFSSVSRKVIIKALEKDKNPETGVPYFPSAICSRFASGNVVMFNRMSAHNLRNIAKKEIERHCSNLEKETGIKINLDDKVYTALLFSEGSAADARTVRSRAEAFFNNELYELLRLVASEKVKTYISDIEKIQVSLDLSLAKEEITALFERPTETKILVFAHEEKVEACKAKCPSFDIMGMQNVDAAVKAIQDNDISFILLDMCYGASKDARAKLNIEDVDSPARDFFKFLCENRKEIPVYLMQDSAYIFSEEEIESFTRLGVRGVIPVNRSAKAFADEIESIAGILHQQNSMVKLSRENKIVTFETAQHVSKSGKSATIKLFDFEMAVAVDSEDTKNILSAVSKPNVKFDDVIGAGDAKKELMYFVDYLKNPKKYMGTGVKAPKGVLLHGAPGTGKTMLAKAMASEADVTFIATEGNEFLKRYVGEGSERVHELFKTARKYAPSILFVDEIDAIAKERQGLGAESNGAEATLTAFLTEMDGFINDPSRPVFVLAATNFEVEPGSAKSLDAALMRRFDRRIYIDLPDKSDRIRFINMKINKNPALSISEMQIENIAMRATGMSLAELDSVVELSLRSAIRAGSTVVTDEIFEEAFETFNSGEVKKWDAASLERVARHEAGHALVCCLGGEVPSYLTIVARGNHGGYMQHAEREGKAIYTRDELLAKVRTALGGRAAEIVYYGENDGISTGASGDLASATATAQRIVCSYGMDADFGPAVVGEAAYKGAMSVEVRAVVNKMLKEQLDAAIKLISDNKDKIDALVEELMVKNHLTGAEIKKIMEK